MSIALYVIATTVFIRVEEYLNIRSSQASNGPTGFIRLFEYKILSACALDIIPKSQLRLLEVEPIIIVQNSYLTATVENTQDCLLDEEKAKFCGNFHSCKLIIEE